MAALDFSWGGSGSVRLLLPSDTLDDRYRGNGYGVEYLAFAEGTRYALMDGLTDAPRLYFGSAGGDSLKAADSGEALAGLDGDDSLVGGNGQGTLLGGAGHDTLSGGKGTDLLVGGVGNDVYVVDTIGDLIIEKLDQGLDRVNSSISWTLGDNLENLTLTGSQATDAIGNAGNNTLTGNSVGNLLYGGAGNDILNGGLGADTLYGGAGDDVYVVDNLGDSVIEYAGEGIDRVNSSISWTLSEDLENLTLAGSEAVDGSGNELDNTLRGNAADNILWGGAGNDSLRGAAGNDTYLFGEDISQEQLWFRRTSNHLEVSIIGSGDKLIVQNWYVGEQYRVERFQTAQGNTLLDSQVQNLVDAMASFAPPAAGQTLLSDSQRSALESVIAANWQ